jgi:GNAT superfamily N-acetyltransferase
MPSRFQLELICAHREYQRLGFGSAVVRWVLGEAVRDGVPVSVAASPLGMKLYLKMGFGWDREWCVWLVRGRRTS